MTIIRPQVFGPSHAPSAPAPNWTDEQSAIFAHAHDSTNLMVCALAGTGKTSTIEEFVRRVPQTQRPNLYLVFNTKNAAEARQKMPSTTTVKTFNGIGHQCWFAGGRTPRVDAKKIQTIYRDMINEISPTDRGTRSIMWAIYDQVISGVGFAKSVGYIPSNLPKSDHSLLSRNSFLGLLDERPDDLVADLIDAALRKSITESYRGWVDYNDQCYMPALFGGVYPKFPLTVVDEYQDANPVNLTLLSKLVGTRRLVGVGDPNQSIYAFRGASTVGMTEAITTYSMTSLSLSISFRCPSAIVNHVRWHVPNFRALRPGGIVNTSGRVQASNISPTSTFIARNNAPLMSMAFRLLTNGHSVSVSGTDIGPRLTATLKRLGPETLSRNQTLDCIAEWEAERLDRDSPTAHDFAECMRIFTRQSDSLGGAIAYANHLFAQSGSIALMTGHKSKGLEFTDVYHLDPWLCKNNKQDHNLAYVISTRSSDRLTEIASDVIEWDQP